MAKTRPGRLYKEIKSMSYTRREFMGGVPGIRIQQFDLGDKHADFPIVVSLVTSERVQITHNALESARVAANRYLTRYCGAMGYHLKLRVYPHEVLRENKQATGAGADRVSQGMRASFGKPIGTAARLEEGQPLLTLRIRPEHWNVAKEAFRRANMKLPTPTRIVLEKGHDQVKLFLEGKIKEAKVPVEAPKEEKKEASSEESSKEAPVEEKGGGLEKPAKEAPKGGAGEKKGEKKSEKK